MKVILQRDVKGVGAAFEAVTTADGYALNYLIPRKLALPATEQALRDAELRLRQLKQRQELDAKLLAQNIAELANVGIVIKTKANEKGHLYDAVGKKEITLAAKAQVGIDLPEDAIKLEKPIKELGTFDIPVSAGSPATSGFGTFSITIETE